MTFKFITGAASDYLIANKFISCFRISFLVVMISLTTACGGGGSDPVNNVNPPGDGSATISDTGGTVSTLDKKASLSIPAGAITNPTTITISRVNQPIVNELFEGIATPAVVYELAPDGIDFGAMSATFSVTLDNSVMVEANGDVAAKLIAVIHVADDGTVTEVSNLKISYDLETGVATVSGEIGHFSKLEFHIGELLSVKVEGVPDELEIGSSFDATASISVGLDFVNGSGLIPSNLNFSSPPIQQTVNNVFTSIKKGLWKETDTYECIFAGEGLYSTSVSWANPAGEEGVWRFIKSRNPTVLREVPSKFITSHYEFIKKVKCLPKPVQVGIRFGSDNSVGEFGEFEVVMELEDPLSEIFAAEGLLISYEYTGTATEGIDWEWVGGAPDFHFDFGETLTFTAKYRLLDDIVMEGDETISWDFDFHPKLDGGSVTIDPPSIPFDLMDDVNEPVLQSGELIFTMTPREIESVIGQSFIVTATEEVKFGAGTRSVTAKMVPRDEGIIGAPVLLPAQEGDGSLSANIDNDTLSVGLLLEGSTNTQRFSFPCVGIGTTFIDVTFTDTTPFPVTKLANDSIQVTCYPSSPLDIFISEFVSIYGPEAFLRMLGEAFLELSMYVGRPFPNPPANTASDAGLSLDEEQNVAVVSGDQGIGAYDLKTGAEISRLSIVFDGAYYIGGVLITTPDLPWLAMYSSMGSAIRHTYNSMTNEWGAGLVTNFNELVTDMIAGPVDTNGHQLAYATVSYTANAVTWNEYDTTGMVWGGPESHQRRRHGGWIDAPEESRGNIVSLAGGFDTPALALIYRGDATPGELWWFDPYDVNPADFTDNSHDALVGMVGIGPRQIRCMIGICVVTNYNSDSITTLLWPGAGSMPSIKDTEQVGDGPIGVELIPDGVGGVYALTTGAASNDYTVTQVGSDGMVQNKTTTAMTNCNSPGFAAFTGDGKQVIVSCKFSNNIITDAL